MSEGAGEVVSPAGVELPKPDDDADILSAAQASELGTNKKEQPESIPTFVASEARLDSEEMEQAGGEISPSQSVSNQPLTGGGVPVSLREDDLVAMGLRDLCECALENGHTLEDVNRCGTKAELLMLLLPRRSETRADVLSSTSPESARPPFGSVAALLVTVFVDFLGVFLSLPILPFLVLELEGQVSDVGNIMAAFSAAQLLSMIWMPLLSDKIGRKPVVIMSNLGSALGYFSVGMSNKIWMLYLFRTAGGLFSGTMGVVQAQLVDMVPAPLLPTYQGYLTGSLFIGLAFGPTIAGSVSTFGNDVPFHVAGAMAGLSTLNTIFFLRSKKKPPPEPVAAKPVGAAASGGDASAESSPAPPAAAPAAAPAVEASIPTPIYIAAVLRFFLMTTVRAQGAVIAVHMQKVRGWAALEVSFLYMGLAILQIAFQAIIYKKIYEKLSLAGVSVMGCSIGAVFSLLVEPASRVPGPWGTVLFVFVYECFMVGGVAALLPLGAISGTIAPKAKRGKAASIDMSSGALGQVVGSLVAPKLWETSNYGIFGMCCGLQVLALLAALYLKSMPAVGPLGRPQKVADERLSVYESAEHSKYDRKEERRFLDELREYIAVQFREKNYYPGTSDLRRRQAVQAAIKLVIYDALPPLHPWGTEERKADITALGRRAPHVTRAMTRIIEGEDPGVVLRAYS
eukprot:Hpha_TRINITY_DN15857_c5_g1::TRINITY_DN15857_c5_g1_i2::g.190658::m.190658